MRRWEMGARDNSQDKSPEERLREIDLEEKELEGYQASLDAQLKGIQEMEPEQRGFWLNKYRENLGDLNRTKTSLLERKEQALSDLHRKNENGGQEIDERERRRGGRGR